MNKYKVFRTLSTIDRDVTKHELVAVEYGKDIYDVTDRLIKAVNDDAGSLEKYWKGFTASTDAPEPADGERYDYCMTAVLEPDYGEKNDLLEYGVTEEKGAEE